jgi:hypothetical protein
MSDKRSELLGAVRFSVPAGWTAQQQLMLQLPCAPAADGINFQPNIVMVIQPVAPLDSTLDAIAEERWQLLAQYLPKLERGLSLWGQLFGQRAVRTSYTWHDGTHQVRQLLVLCALEGRLYEFTFSDVASHFDQHVAEFDRWMAELGIVSANPGTGVVGATARPVTAGADLSALWPGAPK